MVCDFETNMFTNLSFVVSYMSHDLLNKTSISKFIDYVLMHVLILVYQVCLTSKTFNWYSTSIGIIWNKSLSNWYIQGNYYPQRYAWTNPFNWYSCQFLVILGLPPCMIWSKLCLSKILVVHMFFTLAFYAHTLWKA